jgi:hypothetical protein
MSKSAVLSVDIATMLSPINFKKQLLLFDKLFIDVTSFHTSRELFRNEGYSPTKIIQYTANEKTIFYLESVGLVQFQDFPYQAERLFETGEIYPKTGEKQSPYVFNIIAGQIGRTKTLAAQLQGKGEEAYPLYQAELRQRDNVGKDAVVRFMLTNIPEPDASVSWDQIIDFRRDEDTLTKYYALIKWINDVAKRNFTINEITEEYQYLYHEYLAQYRLHKIKQKQGIVEVILHASVDLIAGTLTGGSVCTSLFSLFRQNLKLKEAELTFSGREIAYIHKAEVTFGRN